AVREALEAAGIEPDSAEITMIPESTVACDEKTAEKVMRLVDAFEEHDDVQKVYTNADIPDEVLERIG
ncbi:MAG: YebC/PmpR family DNA-binding transcriptional regulator, partial [Phycisphaerales bacterium]|nr:YebC/PmpR family DNA-binding transcriptional regulator [Phycisphaerales bacterium]